MGNKSVEVLLTLSKRNLVPYSSSLESERTYIIFRQFERLLTNITVIIKFV